MRRRTLRLRNVPSAPCTAASAAAMPSATRLPAELAALREALAALPAVFAPLRVAALRAALLLLRAVFDAPPRLRPARLAAPSTAAAARAKVAFVLLLGVRLMSGI